MSGRKRVRHLINQIKRLTAGTELPSLYEQRRALADQLSAALSRIAELEEQNTRMSIALTGVALMQVHAAKELRK